MKQLIKNPLQETISVENATADMYYGVLFKAWNQKGFLTQRKFNSGVYKCYSTRGLTRGDCYDFVENIESSSLTDVLNRILQDADVYVFDDYRELFRWLSE